MSNNWCPNESVQTDVGHPIYNGVSTFTPFHNVVNNQPQQETVENNKRMLSHENMFHQSYIPQCHLDSMYVPPQQRPTTYSQDRNVQFLTGGLPYNKLENMNCYNDNAFQWASQEHSSFPQLNKCWPPLKYGAKRSTSSVSQNGSPVHVSLENKGLMEKFDNCCTEMIITKTGRRMFPSPVVSLKGLENTTQYFVLFDIVPADDNRYKFHHFNWVISGKSEPLPPIRLYIHPESPLSGSQWMKQKVSFNKVKLTNNTCDQVGHMILNSMHRYQPRIHVVAAPDMYSIQFETFHTFAYPECRFMAVTAYQNTQVTALKIENNPFAKGFRKSEKEKRAKRKSETEVKDDAKDSKGEVDISDSEVDGLNVNEDDPDKVFNKRPIYDLNLEKWNMSEKSNNINKTSETSVQKTFKPSSSDEIKHSLNTCSNSMSLGNNINLNTYNNGYMGASHAMPSYQIDNPVRPYQYLSETPTLSFQYKANGPSFI